MYGNAWSPASERLTGITRKMLDRDGVSRREALTRVLEAVGDPRTYSAMSSTSMHIGSGCSRMPQACRSRLQPSGGGNRRLDGGVQRAIVPKLTPTIGIDARRALTYRSEDNVY
jgi:hypothetical protein